MDEFILNKSQALISRSPYRENFHIAGLGGGKSFGLALVMQLKSTVRKSLGLLAAPTFQQLNTSTLQQVINKALEAKFGWRYGEHYVLNEAPPRAWGAGFEEFSHFRNTNILSTRWGSNVLVTSLQNFDAVRGAEFDYELVDEFALIPPGARSVLIGRLRGEAFARHQREVKQLRGVLEEGRYGKTERAEMKRLFGLYSEDDMFHPKMTPEVALAILDEGAHIYYHQLFWASTPPENPTLLNEILDERKRQTEQTYTFQSKAGEREITEGVFVNERGKPSIYVVESSSHENEQNLPDDYISDTSASYDELTRLREIEGKRVVAVRNRWAYALDDQEVQKRVFRRGLKYEPSLPVYISFDFNKDPMTCLAIQRHEIGKPWTAIKVLREFRLSKSGIKNLCEQIAHHYGYVRYYVTGDATGRWSESPIQDKFVTYYERIADLLSVPEQQVMVPDFNQPHTSSRQQVNTLLESRPDFEIDEERCRYLKDDLLFVQAKPDGTIDKDKDKRLTHLLDCLRYDLQTYESGYLDYMRLVS